MNIQKLLIFVANYKVKLKNIIEFITPSLQNM